MAFKRYGKRRVMRRKGRRPAARKYAKRVFRKRVRRAVVRLAETKKITTQFEKQPLCLSNQSQSLAHNVFTLTPGGATNGYAIAQGVGNSARIGNRVTTKRCVFKFFLNCRAYDSVFNLQPMPTHVKMFFFKSKLDPTFDLNITQLVGSAGSSAKFFEYSNGTTGLIGTVSDLTHVISTDSFTYCTSRTYKLGYAYDGGSNAGIAGGAQPAQYFANNDFKLSAKGSVNVTKWMPKTVKWNDAGEVNTTWMFCLVQIVAADGRTLDSYQKPVNMMCETQFTYVDV